MAAGRIGSSPPPGLGQAAMPKGEAADKTAAKEGVQSGQAGVVAAAANQLETDAAQGAGGASAAQSADFGVQISQGGKTRAEAHKKALNIARNTPDVREDKVQEFKKRIADGSYQVDSGKIADGIMHEAIREHLADNEH